MQRFPESGQIKCIERGTLQTLFHGPSQVYSGKRWPISISGLRGDVEPPYLPSFISLSLSLLGFVSFVFLYKVYKRLARTPLSDLPGPDLESFVAGELCLLVFVILSYAYVLRQLVSVPPRTSRRCEPTASYE